MGTVTYGLRSEYADYLGGTIFVSDERSYDVIGALAGGTSFDVSDTDTELVGALDGYFALERLGWTPDVFSGGTVRDRPLITRPDPNARGLFVRTVDNGEYEASAVAGVLLEATGDTTTDVAAWHGAQLEIEAKGGGILSYRNGPAGEHMSLLNADWLVDSVALAPHPGAIIDVADGATWGLRTTDTIGSNTTATLKHGRMIGNPVVIDGRGQAVIGYMGDGMWDSDVDLVVTGIAKSGEVTYDDGGGDPWSAIVNYQQEQIAKAGGRRWRAKHDDILGVDPTTNGGVDWEEFIGKYAATGIMVKGDVDHRGAYYNRIKGYVQGAGKPPLTWHDSSGNPYGYLGEWSKDRIYALYDAVADPATHDLYVSKVAGNVGVRPVGATASWQLGTFHLGKTYNADDAAFTWDGSRYDLWISQTTQSGHDPLTDDGTSWKRASVGITFTSTTRLTEQKANFNHVYGCRAFGFGVGIEVRNGADVTIRNPEISSNTVGFILNSTGGRVEKYYGEDNNIVGIVGKNSIYAVVDDQSSTAGSWSEVLNLGALTQMPNRRGGKLGYEQFAVGLIPPGQKPAVVDAWHLVTFGDLAPIERNTLVGRQKKVDNGVELVLRFLNGNTTLKDSSANVPLTVVSVIGSALIVDAATPLTGRAGQWIALPGTGPSDDAGVPTTLYTTLFSVTDATHGTIALQATHDPGASTAEVGYGFSLAGSKDFTPAAGDVIRVTSFDGKWVETGGRSIRADPGQPSRRVVTLTDAATVTPDLATTDVGKLLTLSQATLIQNPSGTPKPAQTLELKIKSAAPQPVTWGTLYRGSTLLALPTTTTGGGSMDRYYFEWDADASKWDLVGSPGAY